MAGAVLQNLQEFWRPVRLFIIDEISMVSAEMFELIDRRLQTLRNRPGVLFGGLYIYEA